MGRPVGSANREKPVRDLLRMAALSGGGRRLRVIVDKLLERAEGGDLQAIKEVFDRLDGKSMQPVERSDIALEAMSDDELYGIIRAASRDTLDEPTYARISWASSRRSRSAWSRGGSFDLLALAGRQIAHGSLNDFN